jgi:DNA-directed RNA polymerase subunit N (RpoN/RPB10)|tara:strand:+ start:478 stop:714 length:237 start_codon:yes stop_codon:yes gene_type:complete
MIIPVKCFTCGNVIGSKYLYYLEEVAKKKKEAEMDPTNISYLSEKRQDLSIEGEVLDNLTLTKQCCRRHLLTHVDIFS